MDSEMNTSTQQNVFFTTTSDPSILDPLPPFSDTVNYTLFTIAVVIIVTGILGNLGVLFVILRVSHMRSPMYLCLFSLSVSDLLVLVMSPIITLSTLVQNPPSILGEVVCYLTNVFDRGSLVCSVLIVLLISIERYLATFNPLKASLMITPSRTLMALGVIWVMSYGVTSPMIDMTYYYLHQTNDTILEDCSLIADPWHDIYLTVITLTFFFLPLLVVAVLNVSIMSKVLSEPPTDTGSSIGMARRRSIRRQAAFMILFVVILFIVCIAPFQIVILLEIYAGDAIEPIGDLNWQIVVWCSRFMSFINSAANPIIYNTVSVKFRSAMLDAFGCCKSSNNPTQTTSKTNETMASSSNSHI